MDIEINKRVVYYRRQAHLTQAKVAELIGMKSSTYSQMERVGDISAARIRDLADVFGVDVKVLLYGENFDKPQTQIKFPANSDKTIVLPLLPKGLKYIAGNSEDAAVLSEFHNITKNNRQSIYRLLAYLRQHKHTKLPPLEKIFI